MGTVNAPGDAASPPRLPVVLAAAVELRGLAAAAAAADQCALVAAKLLGAMESERAAALGAAAVIDVDLRTGPSMVASSDTSEARKEVAAVDAVPAAVVRASAAVDGGVAAATVLAAVSR